MDEQSFFFRRRFLDVQRLFNDDFMRSVGLTDHENRHNRGSRASGEDQRSGSRCRRPPEKRHEHAAIIAEILIGQYKQQSIAAQGF